MRFAYQQFIFLALVAMTIGCQKEQLEKLTEQVKQAATEKLDAAAVPNALVAAKGQFRLNLDASIQSDQGELGFTRFNDGRPAVVQLRSFAKGSESYPAILFQGTTNVSDPMQLVGQNITGQLYVQTANNAPVWMSPDDQPVTATVTAIENTELVVNLTGTKMQSADQKTSSISGSCRVVIPAPLLTSSVPATATPPGIQK